MRHAIDRCSLALMVGMLALPALAAEDLDPAAAVDALQALTKPPPGFRPSHAKGLCGEGKFVPAADAATLSRASQFTDGAEVTFRFSVAGGDPAASDKERSPRGLAMALRASDGGEQDLVMLDAPMFVVKDPADFVPLVKAVTPDPATGKPDPDKVAAFFGKHPESTRQAAFLKAMAPPASYATARFFAINTFILESGSGARQPVRWIVEPVAGVLGLNAQQEASSPSEFLADELRRRLAAGAVAWDLVAQLPAAGDDLLDPTTPWPDERPRRTVGRLTLASVDDPGAVGPCQAMMFDPNLLPDGILPSDDPVLAVRSAVYAESLSRRSQ